MEARVEDRICDSGDGVSTVGEKEMRQMNNEWEWREKKSAYLEQVPFIVYVLNHLAMQQQSLGQMTREERVKHDLEHTKKQLAISKLPYMLRVLLHLKLGQQFGPSLAVELEESILMQIVAPEQPNAGPSTTSHQGQQPQQLPVASPTEEDILAQLVQKFGLTIRVASPTTQDDILTELVQSVKHELECRAKKLAYSEQVPLVVRVILNHMAIHQQSVGQMTREERLEHDLAFTRIQLAINNKVPFLLRLSLHLKLTKQFGPALVLELEESIWTQILAPEQPNVCPSTTSHHEQRPQQLPVASPTGDDILAQLVQKFGLTIRVASPTTQDDILDQLVQKIASAFPLASSTGEHTLMERVRNFSLAN